MKMKMEDQRKGTNETYCILSEVMEAKYRYLDFCIILYLV